jgi:hypothetical protein
MAVTKLSTELLGSILSLTIDWSKTINYERVSALTSSTTTLEILRPRLDWTQACQRFQEVGRQVAKYRKAARLTKLKQHRMGDMGVLGLLTGLDVRVKQRIKTLGDIGFLHRRSDVH